MIPMGMPAFTMLARIGIVEHEQKGVTQPSPIASRLADDAFSAAQSPAQLLG